MASYHLKVAEKRIEAPDAVSLWLDVPQDLKGAFAYRPGQFLTIEREDGDERFARQYSLSSTPGPHDRLRITVKKLDQGRMSGWLVDDVAPGEHLEVQAPRGRFFRGIEEARHVVMLAAGSGIAPILSIARFLLEQDEGHRLTVAYGNRRPDAVILKGEVDGLAQDHPDACSIEHVMSRADDGWEGARGRIDRAFIERRLTAWRAASALPMVVYLCGPEAFMDEAEGTLVDNGVTLSDIFRESFDMVLDDDDDEPGLPVAAEGNPGEEGTCEAITAVVGGEETTVTPEAGENILAALLRVEADVPFSCQEGTCASCISKLTEGQAEVRPGVLQTLRQEDLDEGLTLACLSHPKTRRVRIDFDEI